MRATVKSIDRLVADMGARLVDAAGEIVTLTAKYEPRLIASQYPPSATTARLAVQFDRVDRKALDAIGETDHEADHRAVLRSPRMRRRRCCASSSARSRKDSHRARPPPHPQTGRGRLQRWAHEGAQHFAHRTDRRLPHRLQRTPPGERRCAAGLGVDAQLDCGAALRASRSTANCTTSTSRARSIISRAGARGCRRRSRGGTLASTWTNPPTVCGMHARRSTGCRGRSVGGDGSGPFAEVGARRDPWGDLSTRRKTSGWRDSFGVTPVNQSV